MKSIIHHCIDQELIVLGLKEPPAEECSCKEPVSLTRATKMVNSGEAAWVVVGRTRGTAEVVCHLCNGDAEVKNCANCGGKGKEEVSRVWDTYNDQIVRVSRRPVDPNERKVRSGMALRTPRVPTVESKHIWRAYLDETQHAIDRIDEYGLMILEARIALGIKPENPIRREDGGLLEDWGRAPWAKY